MPNATTYAQSDTGSSASTTGAGNYGQGDKGASTSIAIAAVLPSLFAVILLVLIAVYVVFYPPRFTSSSSSLSSSTMANHGRHRKCCFLPFHIHRPHMPHPDLRGIALGTRPWTLSFEIDDSAFMMPRFASIDTPETKEERRKKRIERLNAVLGSIMFRDWRTKEITEHPEAVVSVEPLWCVLVLLVPTRAGTDYIGMYSVICLETIQEKELVRGLMCHHVFHQLCLDGWYSRSHEYCPLCHRPILPPTARAGQHTDGHSTTPTTSTNSPAGPETGEPSGEQPFDAAVAFIV
jgi:Ring finger domain